MLTNTDSNKNNSLLRLEQKFKQLLLQCKYHELTMKTNKDRLNNCLKHSVLLEHELNTERLNKSMIKMQLNALIVTLDKFNNLNNDSSSRLDVNVLTNNKEYLSNKVFAIRVENIGLKQKLAKSNSKISQVMQNQYKYLENVDIAIKLFNSLKEEVKKLENQSHTLIQVLSISKILAKKVSNALDYYKTLKMTQFDHIQYLIKNVAIINSKIHILVNQIEKIQIITTEEENIIVINRTHTEICNKLVEILQIQNNTLYNDICKIFNKSTDK